MKKKIGVILLSLILISLFGCKSPTVTQEIEVISAPIHEVNISYAKSNPPQVLVTIKAGLPDGCSKFHDIKTEISEKSVKIDVLIERPKGSACPAIYGYFDKTVNLGSQFSRGETYIVVVNDQTTSFVMQ